MPLFSVMKELFMEPISVSHAFASAPPRHPAVLCVKGPDNSTDMIMTQWFTWLNIKRNPMISYAMETTANLGLNVEENTHVYLAFPPVHTALLYKAGVRTASEGKSKEYPSGIEPIKIPNVPVEIPRESETVLHISIAGSYKYPFRKIRIYNCSLEEAFGENDEIQVNGE